MEVQIITFANSCEMELTEIAGPYACGIDPSGTGSRFLDLEVTKNVPGALGLSATRQTAFDMKLKMPTDLNCVGGSDGKTCVIRCRNSAFAGPFGGCAAVKQTDGLGRADNSPAGVRTKAAIEAIEKQKIEGQAQLNAMKLNSGAGVVTPQVAVREKDGLMQMMPNQQVPLGHQVERTTAAFIPVNVPANVRDGP